MTNCKEMTLKELRHYVLRNRHDQEAWREYADRPRPNAVTFPPLWEMNQEQLEKFKAFWKEKVASEPTIENWMLQKPN